MRRCLSILLPGICLLVAVIPNAAWGQQVAEIKRMVQGRAQKVESTNQAEIYRPPSRLITPVNEDADLFARDSLRLRDQLWIELKIDQDNPDLDGHAILAEAGSYAIDALEPEKPLTFRLRQGRMSVRLKRGEFGVFLKDRLLSIFGTEVFLQADTTNDTYRVYLKKGHISVREGDQVFFDVDGKDIAWRWQGNEAPAQLTGAAFSRWKQQMKFDSRAVWRKPFFKRTWVRLGLVTLVGAATFCALECGGDNGPTTAIGDVIISILD